MVRKAIKFRDYLVKLDLEGKKNITWRLFDEKNLQKGDTVDLINWNTGEKFGEGFITELWEKKMSELDDNDFDGHEKFASTEEMYHTYRKYYGDKVGSDTIVKVIRFKLK